MTLLALWAGKLTLLLLQLLGKRGSSFPGLVIERIHRGFLRQMLAQLPGGVIVVSGTNGKTTTTKMVTTVLASEQRVLTNSTGANFTRGIASSIAAESSWRGKLPHTMAVFELDEAWAVHFCDEVAPRGVLVTNVMRDQMDRFGEIDHTARMLTAVVSRATDFVVLNADDPRVRAMASAATVPVSYFGVGAQLRSVFITDDELHAGPVQGEAQVATRPAPDVTLERIRPGRIDVVVDGTTRPVGLQIFGSHNAQNATAALAVARRTGVSVDHAVAALEGMTAAFGRGEFIELGGRRILLQLVKNPGGFRYSLMDVDSIDPSAVLIVINDDYADGRDVSWLWDVDFRGLEPYPLSVSGTRATDMELRLVYDGLPVLWCEPDLRAAIERVAADVPDGSTVVVCATYTAMFEMRRILSTMTDVERV